jgi:hypothetical protein
MSRSLTVCLESAVDLRRPERRLLDRLKDCVVNKASAPGDLDDDSGSDADSTEEREGGQPPLFLKKVVVEIQVGKLIIQSDRFSIKGGTSQVLTRNGKPFKVDVPIRSRREQISIRAIKQHNRRRDSLIGDAVAAPGVTKVVLLRKGKERGVIRLSVADPRASRASPPAPLPASPPSSMRSSGRVPSTASAGIRSDIADDDVEDPSVALLGTADDGEVEDFTKHPTKHESDFESDDAAIPRNTRRNLLFLAIGLIALPFVWWAVGGLTSGSSSSVYSTPGPADVTKESHEAPPPPHEETRWQRMKDRLRPRIEEGRARMREHEARIQDELGQATGVYAAEFAKADAIDRIARAMRPYKATPWGKMQSGSSAAWYPLDYRDFPLHEKVVSQKRPQGELNFANGHAGDLLEHSKWSALQAALWYKTGSKWVEGVNPALAIMGGFLHDMGKAGDCAFSCIKKLAELPETPHVVEFVPHDDLESNREEHCYLDTYSQLKYEGQNDATHPIFSAEYLVNGQDGKNVFFLECPSEDEMRDMWHAEAVGSPRHLARYRDEEFQVASQLEQWKDKWYSGAKDDHRGYLTADMIRNTLGLSKLDQFQLAVAARMTLDLGRMNMAPNDPKHLDADGYLKKFAAAMRMFSDCPGPNCISGTDGTAVFECSQSSTATLELLKLTIAVGAADISADSPSREESRKGTSEVNFVTEKTNAALKLCRHIDKAGSNAEVHGLSPAMVKLVGEICATGCHDDERGVDGQVDWETCALTQKYPGVDAWTTYAFESRGLGYRDQLVSKFNQIANGWSYSQWCGTSPLPESPQTK